MDKPLLEHNNEANEAASGRFFYDLECFTTDLHWISKAFLDDYRTLLPEGKGLIFQDNESDEPEGNSRTIIVLFGEQKTMWQLTETSENGRKCITFTLSGGGILGCSIDDYSLAGGHRGSRILRTSTHDHSYYAICDYIKGEVSLFEAVSWWQKLKNHLQDQGFLDKAEKLYDKKRVSAFALGKFATDRKVQYSVMESESYRPESEALSFFADDKGHKILLFESVLNGSYFEKELEKRQKLHDNIGFTAMSPYEYKPRAVQLSLPGIFIRPATSPSPKT